ncbi:MAG: bacteriohopanetetrol glucosamine biosynthesis glycosyltransferase HpnI [Acidobacteria bacterium]|nr:bacteriohopanetetrol glucosamine biosynthesis glycosyltransferase HpnI [Acidobacteriota bacterium]
MNFVILYLIIFILFLILSSGGLSYYLLAIFSTRRLRKSLPQIIPNALNFPSISLLKPLCGAEPGLEDHLESFFLQDYPSFEILFSASDETDPAVSIVERLTRCYPSVPARLVLTGEPPYANPKVYRLKKMSEEASGEILVITDSDASASPQYLKHMAADFAAPKIGVVTNLYRGVSGTDLWSKLEALGMSTEFMAGVVVANQLEGMKFALGPSMAIRREVLHEIGGFEAMADYLADDFLLGHRTFEAGYRVLLSTFVINHHATPHGFINSFKHRLFWNRSTRFSRPAGYYGQGFTYGLPWVLILFSIAPCWWSAIFLVAVLVARLWLAYELTIRLLEDPQALRRFWLIPLQDLLSFASWVGGFLGREIVWRNKRFRLLEGGRFAPAGFNTKGQRVKGSNKD